MFCRLWSNDIPLTPSQDFFPLLFAGQKLWPLVSIISFTLVPFEHRTVFGGLIGVGWGVFLSLMANNK
jgi:protein Mpv17